MWYITPQPAKICIALTTSPTYYHHPSLIYYNFFMEVMPWSSRKSLVGVWSLGHLNFDSLQKFFNPNGASTSPLWCLQYLMCGLYTWEAPPQTFSISSYSWCHIHFGVGAYQLMWLNATQFLEVCHIHAYNRWFLTQSLCLLTSAKSSLGFKDGCL